MIRFPCGMILILFLLKSCLYLVKATDLAEASLGTAGITATIITMSKR